MKKLILFTFFIVLFSYSVFAYYSSSGGYQVRFMPGAFGSNDSDSGYNVRSNAGDYPGDTFNESGYTGEFQDYDLAGPSAPSPTPTPSAVTGGAGGGKAISLYAITITSLCLNEQSRISVSPSATGQVIVSYEKNNKWHYMNSIDMKRGKAFFTPKLLGRYRFDFKLFNTVSASTEGVAKACGGKPFISPDGFLQTEIPQQITQEKTVFASDLDKPIAIIESKKTKIKFAGLSVLIPVAASLVLLVSVFLLRSPGGSKKKKIKAKGKPTKYAEGSPLNKLDSDLDRIEKELGGLRKKYKF